MKSLPAWSWSITTNAINLGFGIGTGVLVARLLGPGPRGELAEVQFWAGAIAALGICSLPSALSFFIARKEHQASLAASALVLATALAFVSLFAGLLLLNFAVDPALRNLEMLYLAFFVPANFISLTLVAIDHGNQNFARYNAFRLLPQATYLSSILLLWYYGVLGIPTLLAASWLGTFFVCLGRWCLAKPNASSAPNRKQIGELLRTGLTYHATAFAGIFFQNADRLICVTYYSHEDLGRYAVALTVSGAGLGLVSSATSIVLFPKLAAANGTAARRHLIRNALGASCVVALVTNATLALMRRHTYCSSRHPIRNTETPRPPSQILPNSGAARRASPYYARAGSPRHPRQPNRNRRAPSCVVANSSGYASENRAGSESPH